MKNALILFVLFFSFTLHAKKKIELKSPDGQLKTVIDIDNDIYFDISHLQTEILSPSRIFFRLDSGVFLGKNPQILNIKKRSQKQTIKSPFYKRDEVEDNFNEVLINFKGNYSVIFRAYNEGIAYRYQTQFNHDLYVYDEGFELDMPLDNNMYASYVNTDAKSRGGQFFNSFEESYNYLPISKYNDDKLLILPLLIECNDGKKLCITESDLENFPGMFIFNDSNEPKLTSVHATYPKKEARLKDNNSQFNVIAREHYVAKTNGTRSYPWRIFVVSENDGQLADCDMVYRLASPSRIDDISWIKPGKAAWEWWTDWKLAGVDFKSGVNM